ncbi:hypothetical protein QFZ88_005306 [Mesorhizobium sp. YL-MeA3-2017]|uniref:hypothetical protein n=1 Tax=Mesorhizobium sp. YL-MeA3-2017 TaxID=3042284 RepID=UPI0027811E82|nr:hypothetical protein [Mesorhizobium sp. YL-MeA3-2017]MDQ0332924.1 hypothetical protein [Mesorhizobium sp. YL-MeA3-2017]
MSGREHLSLEEFVTAPKKKLVVDVLDARSPEADAGLAEPPANRAEADTIIRQEARKALRRVKRERVKGESFFVNVSLDRRTKRRLKLASFDAETSMQSIIEAAIIKYLDDMGA